MSSENVEAAYQLVESLNRRDLDAALAVLDEDVEFIPRFSSLRGRGHDKVRAWWDEVFGAVSDFKIEIVQIREYDDTLVLEMRVTGHGSGSDTPFDESNWTAVRGRNGKCVWWSNHATESEAVEAAGLSE